MMTDIVTLSRLQFALTAMYHFLFVPLTLGLAFILAIMESVYVMTGKEIYRQMTQYWGRLFGINFAMGVATGITLEFQFGTNWAYYSHYVGDIFGLPLAIEGLMAFFLESTFIGLFFYGWRRLSKVQHLAVTWLLALASNMSALWILIANAWMQHPVGAHFNLQNMRMELTNIWEIIFNPVAQVKFVHTVASGYVTGAVFVLAISSYYLLKQKHLALAKRSFAVASGFGLAAVLSVIVLGDVSGYTIGKVQQVKLAAIEAEWETQAAPAAFTLFGWPDEVSMTTRYAIKIPYMLGIMATRSLDTPIKGLKELIQENEAKIRLGQRALHYFQQYQLHGQRYAHDLQQYLPYLGYGLLLKRYAAKPEQASAAEIQLAARHSVPKVWPLFWSFRVMVGSGILMLLLFMLAFYYNAKRQLQQRRWLLHAAVWALPLPWLACMTGWIVAEYGRQPWAIAEILPTFAAVSTISVEQLWFSLGGLGLLYTFLLVVELYLMVKYVRLGPGDVA
jgi:cytochrome d ubiquinol oxidase subunit I